MLSCPLGKGDKGNPAAGGQVCPVFSHGVRLSLEWIKSSLRLQWCFRADWGVWWYLGHPLFTVPRLVWFSNLTLFPKLDPSLWGCDLNTTLACIRSYSFSSKVNSVHWSCLIVANGPYQAFENNKYHKMPAQKEGVTCPSENSGKNVCLRPAQAKNDAMRANQQSCCSLSLYISPSFWCNIQWIKRIPHSEFNYWYFCILLALWNLVIQGVDFSHLAPKREPEPLLPCFSLFHWPSHLTPSWLPLGVASTVPKSPW